jgi:hypothetical protein
MGVSDLWSAAHSLVICDFHQQGDSRLSDSNPSHIYHRMVDGAGEVPLLYAALSVTQHSNLGTLGEASSIEDIQP